MDTIGLISPGVMGAAIGARLVAHGARVITALADRSELTRARAVAAGLEDAGDLDTAVGQADIVMSVLPPAAAAPTAERAAGSVRRGAVYADLNAVSPETARGMAAVIAAARGRYVDGSIVGGPPPVRGEDRGPRIYLSGPDAAELAPLTDRGLDIRDLAGDVGHASALKMCYAAMTKGTSALQIALLAAAQRLGVEVALHAELAASQSAAWQHMLNGIPQLPAKSGRWVREMEEIAATFASVGLPDGFHQAAARIYRRMAASPAAAEEAGAVDIGRTLADTLEQFLAAG